MAASASGTPGAGVSCLGDIYDRPGCSRSASAVVVGAVASDGDRVGMALATVCAEHEASMVEWLSCPGLPAMVAPVEALDAVRTALAADGGFSELQAARTA